MTNTSRFIDNGDNTITDTTTGLIWKKQTLAIDVNHAGAVQKVAELGEGWRLPTVKELFSLVDHEKHGPAIDPAFECESDWYWTSTPCAWNEAAVWLVHFYDGLVCSSHRCRDACVRAVRASQ